MTNEILKQIADKAHQMLIAHRLLLDPRPYTKTTIDKDWIKRNGTNKVDLSKSSYEDLPTDWKSERDKGALIAYEEVAKKLKEKGVCSAEDIEEIADILHSKWLERNNMRASAEQKNRYQDMSEYEKEKDRIFANATIDVLSCFNKNIISVVINAPIQKVFSFSIDSANTPNWILSMKEEKVSELPIKLGTRYSNTNDGINWSNYICTAFVDSKLFQFEDTASDYVVRYDYLKIDEDKTLLTYSEWQKSGVQLSSPSSISVLELLKQNIEKN